LVREFTNKFKTMLITAVFQAYQITHLYEIARLAEFRHLQGVITR